MCDLPDPLWNGKGYREYEGVLDASTFREFRCLEFEDWRSAGKTGRVVLEWSQEISPARVFGEFSDESGNRVTMP